MRKNTVLYMLLLVVILVGACSKSRHEFIIVNNSDADLIVQYSYFDKARIIYKPRVTAAEKFDDPGMKWREISTNVFDVDTETRIVRVKLNANEALLINTEEDYNGEEPKDFPLSMIALNGKDGNKLFENEVILETFEKQDNGNYVIIYK